MLLTEIDKVHSENHQISIQLTGEDLALVNEWWSENMERLGLLV